MRIGIDASRALVPLRTGPENYSFHLLGALLSSFPSPAPELVLYLNGLSTGFPLSLPPTAQLRSIPFPRLWTQFRLSLEMLQSPPHLLFVPSHVLPMVHPPRSVVTVYDLGYLRHRRAYPFGAWLYLSLSTPYNVRQASRVITLSQASRQDILEHFRVPSRKVVTVYPGVGPEFRPPTDAQAIREAMACYRIRGPYFLFVGTLQPRKNLGQLLQAFARARAQGLEETLVLAGKPGWRAEEIMARAQKLGDAVCLGHYVAPQHLPLLYQGATALVFPSLFEGFGLPLLEAMACGAPVIAARSSSLPEVVGDAGLLVDPLDTEELASAMLRLAQDPHLRQGLASLGQERAQAFSWERAAQETWRVLLEAAEA